MKALIIYAHPEAQGFSSKTLEEVQNILQSKQINFETLDLYKMGYDPVLKLEELYTVGKRDISPENQVIQDKIKESDRLIFIYPVWWGGMPAILKGFMDRVFTPGFAYKYRKDKFIKSIPDKLFNDKKIAIFISSGAPAIMYHAILDPIKIINKFIIFGLFSSKTKTYQTYGARQLDEKKIKELKQEVNSGMSWLLK